MRFLADWIEHVDLARMREFRIARAQAAMAKHGIDAVIAFEYANGRYLAGLRPLWAPNFLLRQAAVMVRGSDRVICFVHLDDTPHRRKIMTWLDQADIREFPTGVVIEGAPVEALEPLRQALSDLGFEKGTVGVDIWTPTASEHLTTLLPDSRIVDANKCLNEARSVKNPDEIELMRWASAVVDRAFEVATRAIEPGVRECEILAEAMHVFYTYGAEIPQCNLVVCSGEGTAPMQRFASDRMVRQGDLVFMDIGACFNGVFSEATRTTVCGRPNDDQRRIYNHVYDLHMAVIERMRPGATAADLQRAVSDLYVGGPFDGYLQKMIIAHGIGVGYAEPPFVPPPGKESQLVLEEGMVLAVVPTIIVPGVSGGGGVRLEDLVHVGVDGPELLTLAPYDESLLGRAL